MHVIPPYNPGVILCHRHGERVRYASLRDAYETLGHWWIHSNVGVDFFSPWYCPRLSETRTADWVVVTEFGEVVPPSEFENLREPRVSYWARRFPPYCGYGPVPGVHRLRGGHHFRRLSHITERRAAALVVLEDGEVAARAKRASSQLPDPWDDHSVAAREDRGWKRHRLTRWKA